MATLARVFRVAARSGIVDDVILFTGESHGI